MSLFETTAIESCRSRRPLLWHLIAYNFHPGAFSSPSARLFFFLLLPFRSSPFCFDLLLYDGPHLPSPPLLLSGPPSLSRMVSSFCILFLLIYLLDVFSIIFFSLIFPSLLCSLGLIHYHCSYVILFSWAYFGYFVILC